MRILSLSIFCLLALSSQSGWGQINKQNAPDNIYKEKLLSFEIMAHSDVTAATVLDRALNAYTSCFTQNDGSSLNWKVMKAIAYGESGFNLAAGLCRNGKRVFNWAPGEGIDSKPNKKCKKNAKYLGLFQADETFCKEVFAKYTENQKRKKYRVNLPNSYKVACDAGRVNPDVNMLIAAYHMNRSLRMIQKSCASAKVEDKVSLLYVGHNDGVGVLKFVLKNTSKDKCSTAGIRKRLEKWYTKYSHLDFDAGMKKFDYGRKKIVTFAKKFSVTKIDNEFSEVERKYLCPVNLGMPVWDILRAIDAQMD
jgi:hypothetical protein